MGFNYEYQSPRTKKLNSEHLPTGVIILISKDTATGIVCPREKVLWSIEFIGVVNFLSGTSELSACPPVEDMSLVQVGVCCIVRWVKVHN